MRSRPRPIAITALSISSIVDIPVEIASGLPVAFIVRRRSWSVSEADAALYIGGSNCSMKSTDGSSQHEANQRIPCSRQKRSISAYSCQPNSTLWR